MRAGVVSRVWQKIGETDTRLLRWERGGLSIFIIVGFEVTAVGRANGRNTVRKQCML